MLLCLYVQSNLKAYAIKLQQRISSFNFILIPIYLGNLDERVSDRVLYDILIQAGRVVDLYIPRDKETDKPKGFAFAEYESEEIAEYAVKLFSGLVTLYNRTLKFAVSPCYLLLLSCIYSPFSNCLSVNALCAENYYLDFFFWLHF